MSDSRYLTRPHAHDAVPATFYHVAVSYPHMLDEGGRRAILGCRDAGTAVPLPTFHLIVHLDHVLAGGRDDPPRIEHHAGDGVVVGVGVVYHLSAGPRSG